MTRVTDIRFVGYGVSDLESERVFYRQTWGLREAAERDGMFYFSTQAHDEPYVVRLRRSPQKRLDVIGLATDSAASVDSLFTAVRDARCKVIFEPKRLGGPGGGYGFRFFSPDGLPFEISSDVERGAARALQRGEGIPEKISHVVLHSPDHKAAVRFFIDVLGFRLSDWLGDFMAFLRCNEWHHRLAVLPGPPCLNHVAYDVPNVDEMMRGIARLRQAGVDIRWGPGRHTAGNNTFSYFTTPNGFAVEYTAELERVDESKWTPTVYTPGPGVMDQWGVGVGGPQAMPHPEKDAGLFQPIDV